MNSQTSTTSISASGATTWPVISHNPKSLYIKPYRYRLVCNPPINKIKGILLSIYLLKSCYYLKTVFRVINHLSFVIYFFCNYCMAAGWIIGSRKIYNRFMRSVNGNYQSRILHLNKGKSFISNYKASLEDLLATNSPAICSINEANLLIGSDLHTKGILDYRCEASSPPIGSNIARVCLFLKSSLLYKHRID